MAVDPVKTALDVALNGDAELADLLSGPGEIHHEIAPAGTAPPYIIFHRGSGASVWTFQGGSTDENALWVVRGACRGLSSNPAEEIDARCQEVLHRAKLTLPQGRVTVLRESAKNSREDKDGETWYLVGSVYRLRSAGT